MNTRNVNENNRPPPVEQPAVLRIFLASVGRARRQVSMYGGEHPNSQAALADLSERINELARVYECPTCVLTRDAVIANQHYYAGSLDSVEMHERLHARGAMAFTIHGEPPAEQVREFLAFLNADPREVRLQSGASNYLRMRGVTRIVVTESVYGSADEEDAGSRERGEWERATDDMVIAAVIDWLAKQDTEHDTPPPKLPITRILSDPDSAARLIGEAVAMLYTSRRDRTQGECVAEVIQDLRSCASDNAQEWDKATPRIRKALANLPRDMQPAAVGFVLGSGETDGHAADVEEAETLVQGVLQAMIAGRDGSNVPHPQIFDRFFGATAPGLLSTWKRELEPASVLESTGHTLEALLTWETNACEHGRIAIALAGLTARALEINDCHGVLLFTEWLLNEALQDTELGWRRANVRAALEGMDRDVLTRVVETLAAMHKPRSDEAACTMLELVPAAALELLAQCCAPAMQALRPTLTRVAVELGQQAHPTLSRMLHEGSQAERMAALGILAETGKMWAADEIVGEIRRGDTDLIVAALEVLPNLRVPLVTETCIKLLGHNQSRVRIAALAALAKTRNPSAVHSVARMAFRRNYFGKQRISESIAALHTLAAIGGPEARRYLESAATRRPLIGRSRYEPIRREAQRLLKGSDSQSGSNYSEAA